ncbi:MAG: CRISPR-associated RAMP protein Csx7 [Candidatus Hadarchaeales archaeon]
MQWISHANILRETSFNFILTNEAPLRIGCGGEPPLEALSDLAVLRIPSKFGEVPYIPGSSLKGVFRSFCAKLLARKGLRVCELSGNRCGVEREKEEREKDIEKFAKQACLLCKIFGTQGYKGLVSFLDAFPWDGQQLYPFRLGVRRGIRIGRKSGKAENLFDIEYVEPRAKFKSSIRCLNLPNFALGLLSRVLLCLHEGEVKIGGFKTRGFGEVRLEEIEIRNRDVRGTGKKMTALDPLDRDVEVEEMEVENDWLVARGDAAWGVLRKLAQLWEVVKLWGGST